MFLFIILINLPDPPQEEPRYITTWEEMDFDDPELKPGLYSEDGTYMMSFEEAKQLGFGDGVEVTGSEDPDKAWRCP